MDVRCSRCGTDYEFDDTLISERGTTVKCTNCGYQFKIFPPSTAASAPERWLVRTTAGKELVFTSLRELQRGITERKVSPNDLLSRGKQPARPLGSIPELEPFFTTSSSAPRGFQSAPSTLHGVAPPTPVPPRTVEDERPTRRDVGTSERPERSLSSTLPVSSPPPAAAGFEQSVARPMILGSVAPPSPQPQPVGPQASPARPEVASTTPPPKPKTRLTQAQAALDQTAKVAAAPIAPAPIAPAPIAPAPIAPAPERPFEATMPAVRSPVPDPKPVASKKLTQASDLGSPAAVSKPQVRGRGFDVTMPVPSPPRAAGTPSPSSVGASPSSRRERFPSYDEFPEPEPEPGRRARSRWIAGLVFLGVAGLLGATVGRQYISRFTSAATPEGTRDERASRFLAEGVRLLDQADYEAAQEHLLKAQGLADRDPAVLAAMARLETLRADVYWLRLRLLDPTAAGLVQATERELGRRVGKARQAVDAAFAVAPEDPVVTRARVDAMRIAGEEKKAREWIQPVAANPSDPQNAYVLAALDLAEAAPAWDTVIDRLRTAAVSEREASRARAALVYALVRAGRGVEAEGELAKIASATRPHALLEELSGFVARFKVPGDAGSDAEREVSSAVEPAKPAALDTGLPPDTKPSDTKATDTKPSGDFRTRLTRAAGAASGGDLETAHGLYMSVLNEQPTNTEALSGLADIARRRGDSAAAARLYARVLDANPSYLPALMASADQKWESGERKGAIALYKRVVEQAGSSSDYGQRAASRIAQGEGESAASPNAGSDAAAAPSDTGANPGSSP